MSPRIIELLKSKRIACENTILHNKYHMPEYREYTPQEQERDLQKEHNREQVLELVRVLLPEWRPSSVEILWTIRILIFLGIILGLLTLIGGPLGITLWDWLKLLIVPVVIAGIGIWFNRQQRERELMIAEQHAQDAALNAYVLQMAQLLADKNRPLSRGSPNDSLSMVARAQTLMVLTRLDGIRKVSVLRFIYESGLINTQRCVVSLRGADLSNANLGDKSNVDELVKEGSPWEAVGYSILRPLFLGSVTLPEANLSGVDLSGAYLDGVDLRGADLRFAYLPNVRLRYANISGANLSGAFLNGADLRSTDLAGADLSLVSLWHVYDLSNANLAGAKGVDETLQRLAGFKDGLLLEGVTMPNGQKYEDWVKTNRGT